MEKLYGKLELVDLPLEALAVTLRSVLGEYVDATRSITADEPRDFEIGSILALLLSERCLLPKTSLRIPALWTLASMFSRAKISSHPFLSTLLMYAVDDPGGGPSFKVASDFEERWTVFCCLTGKMEMLGKASTNEIMANAIQHRNSILQTLRESSYSQLLSQLSGARSRPTTLSAVFAVPNGHSIAHSSPTISEAIAAANRIFSPSPIQPDPPSASQLLSFKPRFVLPPPPIMPLTESDLIWLDPDPAQYNVEFDYSTCDEIPKQDEVKRLMFVALQGPLTHSQQQFVTEQFNRRPKLIFKCGVIPDNLSELVENNPTIAYELLSRMMGTEKLNDYLQVLVNMNVSLHSMEVVNRLATASDVNSMSASASSSPPQPSSTYSSPPHSSNITGSLPVEFIHTYISNCIHNCETIKDKYMQNRQVRLVCVFLQSLLRNRIVTVQDSYHEIQAFCISFSRIKEATALFRLLKKEGDVLTK
ncbi:hypothetical protein BJ742DRAFT_841577 [Cladochytrium replicatum]|nr:hypothetical protein BJ742DRAFT_841577 [Cladochytrium replicatum]